MWAKGGIYNFLEEFLKGGRCVILFFSVGWNVYEMAGAPVAILDHKVTLEKNRIHAQCSNNMAWWQTILVLD